MPVGVRDIGSMRAGAETFWYFVFAFDAGVAPESTRKDAELEGRASFAPPRP